MVLLIESALAYFFYSTAFLAVSTVPLILCITAANVLNYYQDLSRKFEGKSGTLFVTAGFSKSEDGKDIAMA